MTNFILISCCKNDKVAGLNLEVFCFAVVLTALLADVGILLIALVIRQPCVYTVVSFTLPYHCAPCEDTLGKADCYFPR